MKVFPEKPTDERYVQSIRKTLKRTRWYFAWRLILGLFALVGVGKLVQMSILFLSGQASSGTQQGLVFLTFLASGVVGFVVGLLAAKVLAMLVIPVVDRRTHELLVSTWDRLQALENELEQFDRDAQAVL